MWGGLPASGRHGWVSWLAYSLPVVLAASKPIPSSVLESQSWLTSTSYLACQKLSRAGDIFVTGLNGRLKPFGC